MQSLELIQVRIAVDFAFEPSARFAHSQLSVNTLPNITSNQATKFGIVHTQPEGKVHLD